HLVLHQNKAFYGVLLRRGKIRQHFRINLLKRRWNFMGKILKWGAISILLLVLSECGHNDDTADEDNGDAPLQVVTSFTILQDMVEQIVGDLVETHNLVPVGTDPHEYEPIPEDIKKATDADALFYNGLNLEGGKDGWFMRMVDSVGQNEDNVYSLTEQVDPMYIGGDDEHEEEINPHS